MGCGDQPAAAIITGGALVARGLVACPMQVRAFNISVRDGRTPRSISICVIAVPAWVPASADTNMSATKGMGKKLVST